MRICYYVTPIHQNPTGGAYSAPPDHLAGFKGGASRQDGHEAGEGRTRKGRGKGRTMKRCGERGRVERRENIAVVVSRDGYGSSFVTHDPCDPSHS